MVDSSKKNGSVPHVKFECGYASTFIKKVVTYPRSATATRGTLPLLWKNGNVPGRYHFFQNNGNVPNNNLKIPDIGYVTIFPKSGNVPKVTFWPRGRYHFCEKSGNVPVVGFPALGYVTTFLEKVCLGLIYCAVFCKYHDFIVLFMSLALKFLY